jgi:hypothetical protein
MDQRGKLSPLMPATSGGELLAAPGLLGVAIRRGVRPTSKRLSSVWKFLAFTLLLCAGCQQTKTHTPIVAQTPNYLNAGDTVRITFPAAPELNQSQKIGTDGSLSLPLVGEVHAAGKSPQQLQTELANLY